MTQGFEAGHSGQFFEACIEREFTSRGVPVFSWRNAGDNGDMFAPRFLLRRVPYVNIYRDEGCSEFLYRDFGLGDIRIECRWQESSGSTDEKFPFFWGNALIVPEPEVWLVVDGGGARKSALKWLEDTAHEYGRSPHRTKTIRVLNLPQTRKLVRNMFTAKVAA
jgi:hypothetical protein